MPRPSSLPTAGSLNDPELPIESLQAFLDEVVALLDNITGPWAPLLFKRADWQPLAAAWEEYKQQTLSAVQNTLSNIRPEALVEHGLAPDSRQLRLKLHGLNTAWQSFFDFGTVRLLRKLLDWINSILGSLAAIIPGVDGIEEIKEAIKNLIQDEES